MPIADLLVDAAAGHKIISFMDGNAGYNQIFMAEEDISKTAFNCPGAIGLFEWVVLERSRKYGLKMNPNKCAFGVLAGEFLGFLVHEKGIEVGKKSLQSIKNIQPPTNKKELQSLVGKINFIRRFISNLSGRIRAFTPLLKLKADQEFKWEPQHQKVLNDIKKYLTTPPVMVPPKSGMPFKLYLAADSDFIGSALTQEQEGKERVIFYLSRRLLDVVTRYSEVERLCLCLYFSYTKLRHYLLASECTIVCKADVVRYILSAPILKGRLGKWILAIAEFVLKYESAKAS